MAKTRRGPGGISVKVTAGPALDTSYEPTRYALALRRKAANRTRRQQGSEPLPDLRAGSCSTCGGWGVVRSVRCPACGGAG